MVTLLIGNKNYSSWSMRPWLALTWAAIPFEERVLPLGHLGYGKSKMPDIRAASPSGRVPALKLDDGATIWDSMAICEWAHEAAPHAGLWPADGTQRARARAAAAEMHAGFQSLRKEAPMNMRRRRAPRDWSADTRGDLERLEELWGDCLARSGGPYLFGARTIADAFYAPVATRLRTYGIEMSATARAYCDTLFKDDAFRAWEDAAIAEPWALEDMDSI